MVTRHHIFYQAPRLLLKVRVPMKTLNEYLRLPYRMEIVEDPDEGGFVVSYPDLPGCITWGETVESAVANAQDAKREGISMNQYCVYLLSKNDATSAR